MTLFSVVALSLQAVFPHRACLPRMCQRAIHLRSTVSALEIDKSPSSVGLASTFASHVSEVDTRDESESEFEETLLPEEGRKRTSRGGGSARWKRPRQHVNPLASHHQQPLALPDDWDSRAFSKPQPLHIDIGCASGHFCVSLSEQRPEMNVLGLEIRVPLVERANDWVEKRAISNLRFLACNANVDLTTIVRASRSTLESVTIQFPDPWFKKRHHKRRVVQPELVEQIAQFLRPGGTLFVQSDVRELAEAMREQIELTAADRLVVTPGPEGNGWLAQNPIGIATEREIATARKGGDVWRAVYTKV